MSVVQYCVVQLLLVFCDLNVLFQLDDQSIEHQKRLDGCFGFEVYCLLLLFHLLEQDLQMLALVLHHGGFLVALRDPQFSPVPIECLVGQFICQLVDV